jgi:hypothetical protein
MLDLIKGFFCIYWDHQVVFVFASVNVVYYVYWFSYDHWFFGGFGVAQFDNLGKTYRLKTIELAVLQPSFLSAFSLLGIHSLSISCHQAEAKRPAGNRVPTTSHKLPWQLNTIFPLHRDFFWKRFSPKSLLANLGKLISANVCVWETGTSDIGQDLR